MRTFPRKKEKQWRGKMSFLEEEKIRRSRHFVQLQEENNSKKKTVLRKI